MIWLKQNENIIGYVPFLKKEYSEKQIRQMSNYNKYSGWSNLSKLVMLIQGIEFSFDDGLSGQYRVATKKIVDITFDFYFECFSLPTDSTMEIYVQQIFEVFNNLTLYKVDIIKEKELTEKLKNAKSLLGNFVSFQNWFSIEDDIFSFRENAQTAYTNLSNLQKIFVNMEHNIDINNLFADADNSIIEKIYENRWPKFKLYMSDYSELDRLTY